MKDKSRSLGGVWTDCEYDLFVYSEEKNNGYWMTTYEKPTTYGLGPLKDLEPLEIEPGWKSLCDDYQFPMEFLI